MIVVWRLSLASVVVGSLGLALIGGGALGLTLISIAGCLTLIVPIHIVIPVNIVALLWWVIDIRIRLNNPDSDGSSLHSNRYIAILLND